MCNAMHLRLVDTTAAKTPLGLHHTGKQRVSENKRGASAQNKVEVQNAGLIGCRRLNMLSTEHGVAGVFRPFRASTSEPLILRVPEGTALRDTVSKDSATAANIGTLEPPGAPARTIWK